MCSCWYWNSSTLAKATYFMSHLVCNKCILDKKFALVGTQAWICVWNLGMAYFWYIFFVVKNMPEMFSLKFQWILWRPAHGPFHRERLTMNNNWAMNKMAWLSSVTRWLHLPYRISAVSPDAADKGSAMFRPRLSFVLKITWENDLLAFPCRSCLLLLLLNYY